MSASELQPSLKDLAVSKQFAIVRNEALVLSVYAILGGSDGHFRTGDVLKDMTLLLRNGVTYLSSYGTEFGRWDQRLNGVVSDLPVSDDDYFGYVDPDYDYDHEIYLGTYSKADFLVLFEDICSHFVNFCPDRRDEYALALAQNGLSLNPPSS